MDYLKLFQNHTEYEAFVSGDTMVKPNVSHCVQENEVHYNPKVTYKITVGENVFNVDYTYNNENNRYEATISPSSDVIVNTGTDFIIEFPYLYEGDISSDSVANEFLGVMNNYPYGAGQWTLDNTKIEYVDNKYVFSASHTSSTTNITLTRVWFNTSHFGVNVLFEYE